MFSENHHSIQIQIQSIRGTLQGNLYCELKGHSLCNKNIGKRMGSKLCGMKTVNCCFGN